MKEYIGQQVGSFRIERLLGQGGMAWVFEARHVHLGTLAAVKVMFPHLVREEKVYKRFVAEATVMARLKHPNIATVFDFVAEDELLAIVMEHLPGQSLHEVMKARREPYPVPEAVAIFRQVLDAVGYAHGKGVVHRDLKPANIMLSESGGKVVAKVLDFGLARILGSVEERTRAGAKLGTVWYMSPEQCRGQQAVGPASDIYALGVSLYEMVTGAVPFVAADDYEIMKAHIEAAPVPPSRVNPGVPPALEAVILKALQKDPNDRYHDAEDFARDLAAVAPAGGAWAGGASPPVPRPDVTPAHGVPGPYPGGPPQGRYPQMGNPQMGNPQMGNPQMGNPQMGQGYSGQPGNLDPALAPTVSPYQTAPPQAGVYGSPATPGPPPSAHPPLSQQQWQAMLAAQQKQKLRLILIIGGVVLFFIVITLITALL